MGGTTDTQGYFDRQAAGWSQRYQGSRHFRRRLETVLAWMAPLPDGLSVLDYGCGSGVMLHALLQSGKTRDLTGVDAASGMIEAARAALMPLGDEARLALDGLEVLDGEAPRYAGRPYDAVLCLGVLEYLEDPRERLTHLAALVKPGGSLVVSVPNRRSWLRRLEGFVAGHPGWFKALGLFPHLTSPEHYLRYQKHQFTVGELDAWLAALGMHRRKARFHVAPALLGGLEAVESVGMTAILEYHKR